MDGQNNYQDYTANTYQAPPANQGPSGPNGLQVASLVLGILGIPGCCCYGVVGLLLGIIGLILAIVGNSKNKGVGIGVAGLVCSIIAIIFGLLATVYYVLFMMAMAGVGPLSELLNEMGYPAELYDLY